MQLASLPIHQLHGLLVGYQISAVDLTQECLAQIEAFDDEVNAFISVMPEQAIQAAVAAEHRLLDRDRVTPLTGIPIAIKDNIFTVGTPTSCASRYFAGHRADYDASVVRRLQAAGAVIIGKTNMDEFAMGSWATTSFYGPTRNPWDLQRLPGGSSGGSAAAVAAHMAVAALGTDTGGSVRQPASLCGLVGLRPTHGIISNHGLVHSVASLDTIGPMTREVMDCAYLLSILIGEDAADPAARPLARVDPDFLSAGIKGLRIGVPQELMETLESDIDGALATALNELLRLGAKVQAVSIPKIETALATYNVLAAAGAAETFKTIDFEGAGLGEEVTRRILAGVRYLTGDQQARLAEARREQSSLKRAFQRIFKRGVDILFAPTSPITAIRLDEIADYDPERLHLSDMMVVPAALAGLPALSLPAGFSTDGLPIGMQLIGPALSDQWLLRVAYAYEQNTDWHRRRPPHLSDH